MSGQPEVSGVVLSPEDAAVAMRAYDVVGYDVIGLKYDGAFYPELEADDSLVLNDQEALAVLNCVVVTLIKDIKFRDTFRQNNLLDQRIIPAEATLQRWREIVTTYNQRIEREQQVNQVLFDYVTRDTETAQTAADSAEPNAA